MEPIHIILYIVIASTLINVLVIARRRKANPRERRFFWMLAITGLAVLLVLTFLTQVL
jgi:type II secretory pathway component PulM